MEEGRWYLDHLDGRRYDIDVAAQVPHGAVRLHVMGERGGQGFAATPEEIDAMGRIAREAIDAGALGLTTSRTTNHKTSRGEPTPTLTAEEDELVGIAAALGGRGVIEVVSDLRRQEHDDVAVVLGSGAAPAGRRLPAHLRRRRGDLRARRADRCPARAVGPQERLSSRHWSVTGVARKGTHITRRSEPS